MMSQKCEKLTKYNNNNQVLSNPHTTKHKHEQTFTPIALGLVRLDSNENDCV